MKKVRTREEIKKKCERDLTVLFWQWDEDMGEVQHIYAKAIWNESKDPVYVENPLYQNGDVKTPSYKAYCDAIAPIQKRYEENIKRIEAKRDEQLALLDYREAQIKAQLQEWNENDAAKTYDSIMHTGSSNDKYCRS